MVNLKALIALLTLMSLLPSLPGSQTDSTISTELTLYFSLYSKVKELPGLNSHAGNQPLEQETGLFLTKNKICKGKIVLEGAIDNLTGEGLMNYLIKELKEKITEELKEKVINSDNFTFWVRGKNPSKKSAIKILYKKLPEKEAIDKELCFIDILVEGEDIQKAVKNLNPINFGSAKVSGEKSENIQAEVSGQKFENIQKVPDKNDKQWAMGQIIGVIATAVVVFSAIGGVIYFFFLPKKKFSSSLTAAEKEEQEPYEEL